MNPSNTTRRTLGVLAYFLGVLLGIALAALAVWGDLEATLFDVSVRAETSLSSMRCPVFITRGEAGQVSARFENTGSTPVQRAIRVHVSQGFVTLIREERLQLPLQPGESQRVSWAVTADDAAYGALVLVRINTLRQAPMPSQSRSCGIVVLDVPFGSGALVTAAWLLLSLAGIGAGGWLWLRASRPLVGRRRSATGAMITVACVVLAALVAGLAGNWIVGILLLALVLLIVTGILAQTFLET